MIVIFGAITMTLLIIFYSLFNIAVTYATQQTTTYLLVWLFSLLSLNVIVTMLIYGYYYYKTKINPFSGNSGEKGFRGSNGNLGKNIT